MELARFLRRHNQLGMTIKKSDYGNGYCIGHISSQWTLFTIYIDQNGGWSFYRAIPDIDKGIDIEDESLLIQTKEIWLLRCRWIGEWNCFFYGPPKRPKEIWEGKLEQKF